MENNGTYEKITQSKLIYLIWIAILFFTITVDIEGPEKIKEFLVYNNWPDVIPRLEYILEKIITIFITYFLINILRTLLLKLILKFRKGRKSKKMEFARIDEVKDLSILIDSSILFEIAQKDEKEFYKMQTVTFLIFVTSILVIVHSFLHNSSFLERFTAILLLLSSFYKVDDIIYFPSSISKEDFNKYKERRIVKTDIPLPENTRK